MVCVNGTKLDDRLIRTDWDPGFVEGRQFGRGRSGGQVSVGRGGGMAQHATCRIKYVFAGLCLILPVLWCGRYAMSSGRTTTRAGVGLARSIKRGWTGDLMHGKDTNHFAYLCASWGTCVSVQVQSVAFQLTFCRFLNHRQSHLCTVKAPHLSSLLVSIYPVLHCTINYAIERQPSVVE